MVAAYKQSQVTMQPVIMNAHNALWKLPGLCCLMQDVTLLAVAGNDLAYREIGW